MKRYTPFAVLALLFACTSVTEPLCACQPPGGGTAVVTGTVFDPTSAPVEGATVTVRLVKDLTCEEVEPTITGHVQSTTAGRFRATQSWAGGRKCFRVWAEPPLGSGLAPSERQYVRIDYLDRPVPDSVDLVLRLRLVSARE
jgi:hypothetical protein